MFLNLKKKKHCNTFTNIPNSLSFAVIVIIGFRIPMEWHFLYIIVIFFIFHAVLF